MKSHKSNFCGGNFHDWLEVNLLPECNGKCSWCVEKHGHHPKKKASASELVSTAIDSGKSNILLLGGEPTLYPDLVRVIDILDDYERKVYMTTNGSMLDYEYVDRNLRYLTGINISIHSDVLAKNKEITGIHIYERRLLDAIERLKHYDVSVRFNCNVIHGHVDTPKRMMEYIDFAKYMKVDSVRFSELSLSDEFVSIKGWAPGLNDEPFTQGCHQETVINGMPVTFKQVCGLQCKYRPKVTKPEFAQQKQVLYYDGTISQGWQQRKETMDIEVLLKKVKQGKISIKDAMVMLNKPFDEEKFKRGLSQALRGCSYDRGCSHDGTSLKELSGGCSHGRSSRGC